MNRLGEENKSIGIVNKLIHELEIAIVEGQITESLLTKAQTKLDEMDDNLSEPNFRLYELQAIIHYANNEKKEALNYIADAISLEDDARKFSRTGALLAELYLDNNDLNKLVVHSEKPAFKNNSKTIKNSKYSGNIEGWLALYTLRIIGIPFLFLHDLISTWRVYESSTSIVPDILLKYFSFVIMSDIAIATFTIFVYFYYFRKRLLTIKLLTILETGLGIVYIIAGLWLYDLYNQYSLEKSSEIVKLFIYGFIAIIWASYWYLSKRVRATFINE